MSSCGHSNSYIRKSSDALFVPIINLNVTFHSLTEDAYIQSNEQRENLAGFNSLSLSKGARTKRMRKIIEDRRGYGRRQEQNRRHSCQFSVFER